MREFVERVAVITGAASGIGRGIAERCAQEGMKVVLADIEQEPLLLAADELADCGAKVIAVVTDVSKYSDVEHLAQKAVSAFGGVHLLCNNAGVAGGTWVWQNTLADWEWIMGVNLWGVIHGVHAFVPIMLEQGTEGHIVNTASLAGLTAYPGSGIYKVTKHAVVSLSETLYLELEQIGAKIKVSVLCPGGVRTRIGESGRNRPVTHSKAQQTQSSPCDNELVRRLRQRVMQDEALQPSEVADAVLTGIRQERFYILTHPQWNFVIERRVRDMLEGRNPANPMTIRALSDLLVEKASGWLHRRGGGR